MSPSRTGFFYNKEDHVHNPKENRADNFKEGRSTAPRRARRQLQGGPIDNSKEGPLTGLVTNPIIFC